MRMGGVGIGCHRSGLIVRRADTGVHGDDTEQGSEQEQNPLPLPASRSVHDLHPSLPGVWPPRPDGPSRGVRCAAAEVRRGTAGQQAQTR